ncbi:glycosyl transferase family 1 [Halalkaliarchaeum desulfuricum]|uniref:Glycosyl transferase family 1 n=1 Tax=Halalkaliarchaeum desulfuricum TaxID=2055893 RepID=A0A343TGH0_9EURY|nr:glycosyltransferase [Halalkaliarchaeum desulfuricum]AUX08192.1 glycosyl transferase family 1 [Halalkaliarchaeum desulfuricum]
MYRVAAFTDTYLPTVNGVTYTVRTWARRWRARGGRMDVVYPDAPQRDPDVGEYPVESLPFPFYEGFRLGVPSIPADVEGPDIVHAHTPFALGLAARRLAGGASVPLVASYHTPTPEYASYLPGNSRIETCIRRTAAAYERWVLGGADAVVVPSEPTAAELRERTGIEEVFVVPNGVDTERFAPADDADVRAFRRRHDLGSGTLVGYTGRHGYEKRLTEIPPAVADLDVTLVVAGDGPAREEFERSARRHGVDARFLGFLDRKELPSFYSALSAFLFPSPVETQGLVALEANACGTPVVGVDAGALTETVSEGETGYRFPEGDTEGFRDAIERTLSEKETLSRRCLDRRETVCVERSLDTLRDVYERLV